MSRGQVAASAQAAFEYPVAKRHDEVGLLRDGDEHRRWHGAARRMRPAQQGLAGCHAAARQVDQWLEMQLELLRRQRLAQVELQCAPRLRRPLHLAREETMPPRPPVFAAYSAMSAFFSSWSTSLPSCGGTAMLIEASMSMRWQSILNGVFSERTMRCASCSASRGRLQPVCDTTNSSPPKRVITRDHVGGPDGSVQARGDGLEQLISNRMAECVINRLEAVEIDQMNSQCVIAAPHAREQLCEPLTEVCPVGETRQVVEAGEMMRYPLLRTFALGDVFEDHHRAAALNGPARGGDDVLAVERGVEVLEGRLAQASRQLGGDLPWRFALMIAGEDDVADQLREPHAEAHRRILQVQQFDKSLSRPADDRFDRTCINRATYC